MHRQQGVGAITLRSLTQRRRVRAFKIFRSGHQLLIEVGQRQAQWQAAVLGGTAQWRGAVLAVADQA
ncbi:hypothetical protein D3C84_958270 [compost metagenome]